MHSLHWGAAVFSSKASVECKVLELFCQQKPNKSNYVERILNISNTFLWYIIVRITCAIYHVQKALRVMVAEAACELNIAAGQLERNSGILNDLATRFHGIKARKKVSCRGIWLTRSAERWRVRSTDKPNAPEKPYNLAFIP